MSRCKVAKCPDIGEIINTLDDMANYYTEIDKTRKEMISAIIYPAILLIFAIAISTALFPTIAKAIKNHQEQKARELLKNTFWFLSITLAICVCGGIMLKNEIIFILFERGNFLRQDTLITANVFALYLLGLLPFGLAKIFSLWLYAHKKQGKAAKISAISLGTSFIISVILMQFFALYGLALASSIGGFVLFALTIKQFGLKDFKAILLFKKAWFILIGILSIEIIILKIFLMFYSL